MHSQIDINNVVALVTKYICTIWYNHGHKGNRLHILKISIISNHRYHKTIVKKKIHMLQELFLFRI